MSARLGPPRAVVGGARGLAQRFLARLAFGRQALLSPGVMRPCRVASDGQFFSRWGASHFRHFCFGQILRLSLWVSSVFSAPATLHPVTQQLSCGQRFFFTQGRLRVSGFLFGSAGFSGICWKATRAPGHLSARAPRAAVCLKKLLKKKRNSSDSRNGVLPEPR